MDCLPNSTKDSARLQQSPHCSSTLSAAPGRDSSPPLSEQTKENSWTQVRNKRKTRWNIATDLYPSLNNKLDSYFVVKNTESKQIIDNRPAIFNDLKTHGIARDDISELRDGSLLIKCKSPSISSYLSSLSSLGGVIIQAAPHPTLNKSQGTIYAPSLQNLQEDDIQENLKEYGVISVYRLKDRLNGKLRPSHRLLLTFNTVEPPEKVFYTWLPFTVRRHIPLPRRCYNCQIFGHVGSKCTRKSICFYCGQDEHYDTENINPNNRQRCKNPPKCHNCGEPHPASSRTCLFFKYETEISALSINAKISRTEARKRVRAFSSPSGITYAEALKGCYEKKLNFRTDITHLKERRKELISDTRPQSPKSQKRDENQSRIKPILSLPDNKHNLTTSSTKPTGTRPKDNKNKRSLPYDNEVDNEIHLASTSSPVFKLQKLKRRSSKDECYQPTPMVEVHSESSSSQYFSSPYNSTPSKNSNEETLLHNHEENFSNLLTNLNLSYSSASVSSLEDVVVEKENSNKTKEVLEKAVKSTEKSIHDQSNNQELNTQNNSKTKVEDQKENLSSSETLNIRKTNPVISNR